MDETTKLLMKLVEENAKFKAALEYLKIKYEHDKERGYENTDVGIALGFAGMIQKEIKVIKCDNCDDLAYAEEVEE